jgi:rRNA-processing protein FCF1
MMPAQVRIDLFDQLRGIVGAFDPLVLEGTLKELHGLSGERGRNGAAARYGLALADKCMPVRPDEHVTGNVDDQVLSYAVKNRCIVVTNDRHLRDTLLAQGIGVISLRKQKRLELIQR